MNSRLLNDEEQKTFALILSDGDNVTACITSFAKEKHIHSAQLTAIGAFSEATLGFFDFSIKDYKKIPVKQQTEVLTLVGDISVYQNRPLLHAHVVLGKEDGTAVGGHLMHAIVHPTLEIILTESPGWMVRQLDEKIGIPLIKIGYE
jgi:predicted DNA-binding protein with PD1-like motif